MERISVSELGKIIGISNVEGLKYSDLLRLAPRGTVTEEVVARLVRSVDDEELAGLYPSLRSRFRHVVLACLKGRDNERLGGTIEKYGRHTLSDVLAEIAAERFEALQLVNLARWLKPGDVELYLCNLTGFGCWTDSELKFGISRLPEGSPAHRQAAAVRHGRVMQTLPTSDAVLDRWMEVYGDVVTYPEDEHAMRVVLVGELDRLLREGNFEAARRVIFCHVDSPLYAEALDAVEEFLTDVEYKLANDGQWITPAKDFDFMRLLHKWLSDWIGEESEARFEGRYHALGRTRRVLNRVGQILLTTAKTREQVLNLYKYFFADHPLAPRVEERLLELSE